MFADVDLPDPVNGEIQLLESVYEVDKLLMLSDTLVVDNTVIRGDGSVFNELEWDAAVTALKSEGKTITLDDVILVDTTGTATLYDVINEPFSGLAAVEVQNACIFERWGSLGTVKQMRVSIQEATIVNAAQGLTLNGVPQLICELCFFLAAGPPSVQPAPPDWLFYIYDADDLTGPFTTQDINILNTRTNGNAANNANAAFAYLHPSINADANILIAGCAIQGPNQIKPFYTGDEGECTGFADAGGGLVTVSTADTGSLANDDWINILRTENYNGGHVVSNVVANTSFDITTTFVDNPGRGTWHSGSLDQRDPRVNTRDNILIPDSKTIFAAFENGNVQATTITTQDVWVKVAFDGLVDVPQFMERWTMCGDGSVAEFLYQGRNPDLKGFINVNCRITADGGGSAEDTFEFGWGLNDADPVVAYANFVAGVNAQDTFNITFNSLFEVVTGDVCSLFVRCTTGTRDVIIEDIGLFGDEL